ncbi:MAG: RNase adapter RapZ [Nitrospirota bacterium]|nr:RNase adapter RapZ [Nitrospirota bacterium]
MTEGKKKKLSIIILTGLSGAGKSVALNAFEDSGYFCVDNLPSPLIVTFANLCSKTPNISKIAVGIDIRERKFLADFSDKISSLHKYHDVKIIFLEATDEALIRRFKETRRPHPLGLKDLRKALRKEAEYLSAIRQEADTIIDTSSLTPHQLRKLVIDFFLKKGPKEMTVNLVSFGYKYGIPLEADLLFDVRFLPNPYFVKTLKELTGRSPKVKKYVLSQKDTTDFFDKLFPLLNHIIPLYRQEGKSYLTIGVGCTGGRHRSPVILHEIEKALKKQNLATTVTHRDMNVVS